MSKWDKAWDLWAYAVLVLCVVPSRATAGGRKGRRFGGLSKGGSLCEGVGNLSQRNWEVWWVSIKTMKASNLVSLLFCCFSFLPRPSALAVFHSCKYCLTLSSSVRTAYLKETNRKHYFVNDLVTLVFKLFISNFCWRSFRNRRGNINFQGEEDTIYSWNHIGAKSLAENRLALIITWGEEE